MRSLHRTLNLDDITPKCALRDISLGRLQSPNRKRVAFNSKRSTVVWTLEMEGGGTVPPQKGGQG